MRAIKSRADTQTQVSHVTKGNMIKNERKARPDFTMKQETQAMTL